MRVSRGSFAQSFDVSRETIGRLDRYEALLNKWNPKINLVAHSTLGEVWHRHFADSAQLWAHIPDYATSWLDFGSGAGFPALVCAILAQEKQPALRFTLVESDQRKCAFLASISNELGLATRIVPKRIEALPAQQADIITARAVAPLSKLLALTEDHAHKSSVLLFPKGNRYESELTAARKHWHIDAQVIESLTDSGSVILRIEDFARVE